MKKKLLVSAIAATAATTGAFAAPVVAQIAVENQNAGTDIPRVASGGTVVFENQVVRQVGSSAGTPTPTNGVLNAGDTIVFSLPTGMNFVGSPTATASPATATGGVRLQGNQLGDPNTKGLVTLVDTNNDGLNDRASVVVASTADAGDVVRFEGSATWTGTHNAKASNLTANIFVSDKASGNAEVVDSDNVLAITVPALTAPLAQINTNANITIPNKAGDPVVFAGSETSNLILTVPASTAKDKTVILTLGSGLEFDETTKVTVTALTDGAPSITTTDGTAGDNQYTLTLGGATTRDSQYGITINGLEVAQQAAATTVNVSLSGTAGLTGSAPVAILGASGSSAALVTGQNPTKIVAGSKIAQDLPDIVITETFAGDLGAGNVTITAGPGLVFAGSPTATATGFAAPTVTLNTDKTVATIAVAANPTAFPAAPGTITVSNLHATATANAAAGNLTVALGGTASNAPSTVLNVAVAQPRGAVAIKGPDPVPSVGAGTKGNTATFILDEASYAAIDSSASNTPIIVITPPAGVTISNVVESGVGSITDQGVKVIPENGSWLLYVTGETSAPGDANVTVTYDVASSVAVGSPVTFSLSGNSNVEGTVTVANVSNGTKTTVGTIPSVTEGSVNSQSLAPFTITENMGAALSNGNFRVIAPAGVTFAPGAAFSGSVTATGSVVTTFSANDTLLVSLTGVTGGIDNVTVKAKAFVASTVANDSLLSFNITDANEANGSKAGVTGGSVNLAYTGDVQTLDAGAAGTVNVGFSRESNITGGVGPFTVTSSNPAVATVSVNDRAITVRGLSAGTATITVTDSLNSTDTFAVTVNAGAAQETLTGVITSGGAASTAVLRAGASSDAGNTFDDSFSTTDNLDVVGSIEPEAAHVGQAGEVFVVVRALVGENNVWGMLNEDGNWQLWNASPDNLAGLVPARIVDSLAAVEHVDIHKGTLPAGTYRIRVGYMAEGSSLIFNENPLEIVVE